MKDRRTVAILYAGEMGVALARVLSARDVRVVTETASRGPATARRASSASIEILPSLDEVVAASDVVFSLVLPSAAEEVAQAYCERAGLAPRGAIFVETNSIGPDRIASLANRCAEAGVQFVDAAINGLARNLTASGTLFLSGSAAEEIARLFGDALRIEVLGREPGRASAMKMLLSGLSKGICALFVETALTAERHGLLPNMIAEYTRIYPGVMTLIDRMLPTYREHAARRAIEMEETEQTARSAGLDPSVLAGIRHLHQLLAKADLGPGPGRDDLWNTTSLIERLAAQEFLRARPTIENL